MPILEALGMVVMTIGRDCWTGVGLTGAVRRKQCLPTSSNFSKETSYEHQTCKKIDTCKSTLSLNS